jgi:hypothetical protein
MQQGPHPILDAGLFPGGPIRRFRDEEDHETAPRNALE